MKNEARDYLRSQQIILINQILTKRLIRIKFKLFRNEILEVGLFEFVSQSIQNLSTIKIIPKYM